MIRPLDIQVAFNALPDHGARVTQEVAATQYRQVQGLRDSRTENLNRPHRVVENASPYAPGFRSVELSGEATPRQQEIRDRARRRLAEDQDDGDFVRGEPGPLTYAPLSLVGSDHRRKFSDERSGQHLDWSA